MTGKKLIGMLIALAVLAGIAAIQQQDGKKRRPAQADSGTTLFHGVELNGIDGVEIAKGEETAKLVITNGRWVVESLYNYPADFKKLADALRAASEIKMGNPVRAANIDSSEYGLDDVKSIVLKTGGKEVTGVEIGARREASGTAGWANQHFIRKDDSAAVHLVDYDFRPFTEDSTDWIETELLNVSSSEIISVKTGDVELNSVSNSWTLIDLDAEQEEFQSSEANKLRRALQYLNCSTVADPSKTDADLGFTNTVVYTASTTNKTYTVYIGGEVEDGRYIRFSGDVSEKLNGWTYIISTHDASDFLITRDQLVKPKEEGEEASAEE